jgi:hypothetical protein
MFNYKNLETVGVREVTTSLNLDAKDLSSDPKAFVKENLFAAYVLENTWLAMVKEYSPYGWLALATRITQRGLITTIRDAETASLEIIHGRIISDEGLRALQADILSRPLPNVVWGDQGLDQRDPMTVLLQLLRYPKRFSPVLADKIENESIKAFKRMEYRNRGKNLRSEWSLSLYQTSATNRSYREQWVDCVKHAMLSLLDWESLCDEIWDAIYDGELLYSTGVAYDSKQPLLTKLRAVAKKYPGVFYQPFGVPLASSCTGWVATQWTKEYYDEKRVARIAAVPKSYKAARIIAMEDTFRQAVGKKIMQIIDRYMPAEIRLHDQTQNQLLARDGSLDQGLATLDLSSASDSISKVLFRRIFPPNFVACVYPYLGTHTQIGKEVNIMQMMSTSGNVLTFGLESLVFLAITKAGVQWAAEMGEQFQDPRISVYGDDIICPSEAAQYVIMFLTALGFEVNESKSYIGDVPFRESCGSDWYLGVDVSSTYFPRKPVRGWYKKDTWIISESDTAYDSRESVFENTLVSLVSLQQRLSAISTGAATFVQLLIESCSTRRFTHTAYGVPNPTDLRSLMDSPVFIWAPGGKEVAPSTSTKRELGLAGSCYVRAAHSTPIACYPKRSSDLHLTKEDQALYDAYKYESFLRHGPKYSDKLMESLGISDAPRSLAEVAQRPCINWTLLG